MSTKPEAATKRCPACDTELPSDATRCFACGRVQGEQNRCPSCHAIAGVVRRSNAYVCAACGAPRDVGPGQVILDAPVVAPAGRSSALIRGLGFGSGVLGALGAAVLWGAVPGAPGAALALIVAAGGALGLWTALRAAGSRERARAARETRVREQQILDLAEQEGGNLTVTTVARVLGVSMVEADAILTGMADGTRVTVDFDPDGVIHYVFRELSPSQVPPRMRAPTSKGADASPREGGEVELADVSAESAAKRR